MRPNKTFADSMQAKRFLVSRIVEEAHREKLALTESEEKMLYFSESSPTLPDMTEIAEKFATEIDSAEYEKKIKRLSKKAYRHDRGEFPERVADWKEAVRMLKTEDHYLSVMLQIPRAASDLVWLILASLATIALMMGFLLATQWLQENVRGAMRDKVVAAPIALFVALYYLLTTRRGKNLVGRAGDFVRGLMMRVR